MATTDEQQEQKLTKKEFRQYEEEKNEAYLKNIADDPNTSAINRWLARYGYNLMQRAKSGDISKWQKIRFSLIALMALVVLGAKMVISVILPVKKKRVPNNSNDGDNDLKR